MIAVPLDPTEEWAIDPVRRSQAIEAMHLLDSLALEYEGEYNREILPVDLLALFNVTPAEINTHMRNWVKLAVVQAKPKPEEEQIKSCNQQPKE